MLGRGMKGGPHTVLVVEDEEEARLCLTQILEFEGFHAVGCSNGVEALNYLATSEAPSVIVMDIRMPIMSGKELRTKLLKDRRLEKIPVIIVTALEPSAAAGLGALRVFRKPVDVSALVNVIRRNC
jgi:CheY-like chemotaxis protein